MDGDNLLNYITLISFGPVKKEIMEHLAASIYEQCGLACKIEKSINIPKHTYNEVRVQYNSKLILKYFIGNYTFNTPKVIGVTQVDLYVPILKYVFGLAQIQGQCAIISLYRLYPEFYTEPANPGLLLKRAEKIALHELGHTLGLTHCRNKLCVMHSSIQITDMDFKQSIFCSTCSELFNWYREKLHVNTP